MLPVKIHSSFQQLKQTTISFNLGFHNLSLYLLNISSFLTLKKFIAYKYLIIMQFDFASRHDQFYVYILETISSTVLCTLEVL